MYLPWALLLLNFLMGGAFLLGWMDWLHGWMDGWIGRVDGWIGWMDGWMVGWMVGWVDGWVDGCLVAWLVGWMVDIYVHGVHHNGDDTHAHICNPKPNPIQSLPTTHHPTTTTTTNRHRRLHRPRAGHGRRPPLLLPGACVRDFVFLILGVWSDGVGTVFMCVFLCVCVL